MAEVKITVRAIDKSAKTLGAIEQRLKTFSALQKQRASEQAAAQERVVAAAARQDAALGDLFGTIKTAGKDLLFTFGAMAAGVAAFGVAAKKGFEFLEKGAELRFAKVQFDNLTASINTTSDSLDRRFLEATGGMVDGAERIRLASQIISLGLGKTEDDVIRIATVVSQLGLNMQQVILTFANNSIMRLDALGLSVEDVTDRVKELDEAGIDGDTFDIAVLEALEDRLLLVGSAIEEDIGSIKRLEAAWIDLGNVFTEGSAGGQFVDDTADDLRAITSILEAQEQGVISTSKAWQLILGLWGNADKELQTLEDAFRGPTTALTEASVRLETWGLGYRKIISATVPVVRSTKVATTTFRDQISAIEDLTSAAEEFIDVEDAVVIAQMQTNQAILETTLSAREQWLEFGMLRDIHQVVGTTITALGTNMQEFNKTTEDVTGAIDNWLGVLEQGTDNELRGYDNALLAIVAAYQRGILTAPQFEEALRELQAAMEDSSPVVDTYAGAVWNFGEAWASAATGVQNTLTQLQNLLIFLNAHPELFTAGTQRQFIGTINEPTGGTGGAGGTGGTNPTPGINPGGANQPGTTIPGGPPGQTPGGTTLNLVLEGQVLGSILSTELGALVRESMQGAGAFTGL